MHNDPNEIALHAEDERTLRNAAAKAFKPVRHLSYFERQQARALGKSLDSFGNIDLNDAANSATQAGRASRTNPNVRASQSYFKTQAQPGPFEAVKLEKPEPRDEVALKSECARHCQRDGRNVTGRTNCRYCSGEGYVAKAERLKQGNSRNHPRNVFKRTR